jgi:hypothetical protein
VLSNHARSDISSEREETNLSIGYLSRKRILYQTRGTRYSVPADLLDDIDASMRP